MWACAVAKTDDNDWLMASTFLDMTLTCPESSDDKLPGGLKKFKSGLYAVPCGRYAFIRILRTLLNIYHIEPMDSEEIWKPLQTMSFHAKEKPEKWNINIYDADLHHKIRDLIRTHATAKAVVAAPGERFNNGILTNIDIAQRSRELAGTPPTIESLAREDDCLLQWPQVALASLIISYL